MQRYQVEESSKGIIFPYENATLISTEKMKHRYPRTWTYLLQHKTYLENRENGKMKGRQWYAYTRSQALITMYLPKIITPDYYAHASYCLDQQGQFFFCGGGAGGYGIVLKSSFDSKYVLGLLNSKLLDWYLHKITIRAYQTAYMYIKKYIEKLPIRTIDFTNPTDKSRHDRMVELVDRMLDLHQQLAEAKTPQTKTVLQRQIETTDRQIDELVYELYRLTDDEIEIVEKSLG